MKTIWLCLLSFILCIYAGCSSSDNPPPEPTPEPTMESFFEPIPPTLSPPDEGGIINNASSDIIAGNEKTTSETNDPTPVPVVMNRWFYLINGHDIQQFSTSTSTTSAYILTVSGSAPWGAPSPNGGTAVSVASLDLNEISPDKRGRSLWKAVQSSVSGQFYLRSAESFEPQLNGGDYTGMYPSLLLGYGATFAPLDLGYVPAWNSSACVFWNQEESPNGDQSAFQMWSYDTETAELLNFSNGPLYYASGDALVGTGSGASENQWYTYPNYYLGQIVGQQDSVPAFPAFPLDAVTYNSCTVPDGGTEAGQQAAYEYISNQAIKGLTQGDECYEDIRCEYTNLNMTSALAACNSDCTDWAEDPTNTNPGSYNNVTISDTDWQAVTCQLSMECAYASQIQTTFNNYNDILDWIFTEDASTLPQLGSDLNLSAETSVNVVAIDIIEGILYTVLSAADPVLGVFANLMEMGVSAAEDAGESTAQQLTQSITTTVAKLYSDLGTQMQLLMDQTSNGENLILSDWGRLKLAGPLTEIPGYNGLGISDDDQATIEIYAKKGYILSAMQVLLPLAYSLAPNVCLDNDTPFDKMPSQAYYAYSTFGTQTGSYTVNYLFETGNTKNFPDPQVMTTDIMGNGANSFELFNGLNGWNGIPQTAKPTQTNLGVSGTVVTLFNASSADLSVEVSPSQGMIAAPTYFFNSNGYCDYASGLHGSETSANFELRPYGYLPVWVTAKNEQLTVDITVTDSGTGGQACSFTFGSDGSLCNVPAWAWDLSFGTGWSGTDISSQAPGCVNGGTMTFPAGLWLTLYQTD